MSVYGLFVFNFSRAKIHHTHISLSSLAHLQHGHILIMLLDLACMSFRGSDSGSLGGCHRLDAVDFRERLRFLHDYSFRSLLVNGLS